MILAPVSTHATRDPSTHSRNRKHPRHTSPLDFRRAYSLTNHHPTFLGPLAPSHANANPRPERFQAQDTHSEQPLVTTFLPPSLPRTIRPVAKVHSDLRTPEHDPPGSRLKSEHCQWFLGRLATSLRRSYPKAYLVRIKMQSPV